MTINFFFVLINAGATFRASPIFTSDKFILTNIKIKTDQ